MSKKRVAVAVLVTLATLAVGAWLWPLSPWRWRVATYLLCFYVIICVWGWGRWPWWRWKG